MMTVIKRNAWLALLVAAFATGCGNSSIHPGLRGVAEGGTAAALGKTADFQVTKTIVPSEWSRIERLSSTYSGFPKENARPNGKQTDPEIVEAFGTATPPSSDVLLHFAKDWDKNKGTPVLLVHGTLVDANSSWVHPHGKAGLVDTLTEQGLRVFALTFAHRHGDNVLQAEQIAYCLNRIRQVTGASQVDVIAHSKGTVAARALASGIRKPWMKPYSKDIRRLVLIAGPNLGLDMTFRHSILNYALYPEHNNALLNAPLSWTKMLYMGMWLDTGANSLFTDHGNYFPGQAQLLYRWDKTYPLLPIEQDWYTTYNGGQGFVSYSPGIDKAIAEGGNFIDNLRQHPLDPSVKLVCLAGDSPNLVGVYNENTGPSDGIVFVKSATHTEDMVKGGAELFAKQTLHLNHMDLIIEDESKDWIAKQLLRP